MVDSEPETHASEPPEPPSDSTDSASSCFGPGARCALHVAGTMLVAVLMALWYLPLESLIYLVERATRPSRLARHLWLGLVSHVLLAAGVWFAVAALGRRGWRRMSGSPRRLVSGRNGAVLTETLIVLPVFLLLTFGLAQLALNNVAGILSRVAQYEAARAAWLWQPEARAQRGDMRSRRDVERRVRLTVALVMAPVASGGATPRNIRLTRDARKLVRAMAWRFPSTRGLVQSRSRSIARALRDEPDGRSLTGALGLSDFGLRAVRKLRHAYAATRLSDVHVVERSAGGHSGRPRPTIGVRFTYLHVQSMPMVGAIFGRRVTLGRGSARRETYARAITREFHLPKQPHSVNTHVP